MTGFLEERGAQDISPISTEAGGRLNPGAPTAGLISSLLKKRNGDEKPHSAASKINPKAVFFKQKLTKHAVPGRQMSSSAFRECALLQGPDNKDPDNLLKAERGL